MGVGTAPGLSIDTVRIPPFVVDVRHLVGEQKNHLLSLYLHEPLWRYMAHISPSLILSRGQESFWRLQNICTTHCGWLQIIRFVWVRYLATHQNSLPGCTPFGVLSPSCKQLRHVMQTLHESKQDSGQRSSKAPSKQCCQGAGPGAVAA